MSSSLRNNASGRARESRFFQLRRRLCARASLSLFFFLAAGATGLAETPSVETLAKSWSGARAMKDIATQLSFGARALGAPGHDKAIEFIKRELESGGARVVLQEAKTEDEGAGEQKIVNVVGRLDPDNPKRVILGTHYDSIVRAYADRKNPNGPMPGANNSASGVALLLETARVLGSAAERPPLGLDFVFFDGEEGPLSLGAGDPAWRALGSPLFVKRLVELYPGGGPVQSVIFDMVCYRRLLLRPEAFSLKFAPAETRKFWEIGQKVAPTVFSASPTLPILDDHNAFTQARVPSFLVIGFEYEPWFNTTADSLDKCSPTSLEAVGRTLIRYLYAD